MALPDIPLSTGELLVLTPLLDNYHRARGGLETATTVLEEYIRQVAATKAIHLETDYTFALDQKKFIDKSLTAEAAPPAKV